MCFSDIIFEFLRPCLKQKFWTKCFHCITPRFVLGRLRSKKVMVNLGDGTTFRVERARNRSYFDLYFDHLPQIKPVDKAKLAMNHGCLDCSTSLRSFEWCPEFVCFMYEFVCFKYEKLLLCMNLKCLCILRLPLRKKRSVFFLFSLFAVLLFFARFSFVNVFFYLFVLKK